jgi:hypothetical protein
MIDLIPKNVENLNKGKVELENYKNSDLNLQGWKLTNVLDNILFVQYADLSEDGTQVKRGNIWIPLDVVTFTWRIGKVIIAGPECKVVKSGDFIIFPNDKGIKAANINGYSNIVFLSEDRIFGVAEPELEDKNEN